MVLGVFVDRVVRLALVMSVIVLDLVLDFASGVEGGVGPETTAEAEVEASAVARLRILAMRWVRALGVTSVNFLENHFSFIFQKRENLEGLNMRTPTGRKGRMLCVKRWKVCFIQKVVQHTRLSRVLEVAKKEKGKESHTSHFRSKSIIIQFHIVNFENASEEL